MSSTVLQVFEVNAALVILLQNQFSHCLNFQFVLYGHTA